MEISHALTEMALQINPVAYFVVLQDLGEHLNKISIKNQVLNGLNSIKSQRANKFIVYFQNFTNTYDTIENLKDKYDSALVDKRIVGLSIATRPDCINENICKLLKTYTDKYYVSVELGLQTSNDYIGTLINRRYSTKQFIEATKLLNKYNIDVISHIMIGLPNETFDDIKNTVRSVVSKYFFRKTQRNPMIIPLIMNIN